MSSTGELHNKSGWAKWKSKDDNFAKCKSIKSNLIYGAPTEEIPDVSVMIITYKRAAGLKAALDSAINQDYAQPYEIAVVDDSGFDQETDALMKEYCETHKNILYYRHEENIGQYANWNRACELCRTDWYGLLHDDDKLRPEYLQKCIAAVKKTSGKVGLLGSYMKMVGDAKASEGKPLLDSLVNLFIRLRAAKPIHLRLKDNIKYIYILNSSFIDRRKLLEIGGLNDEYFPSSDFAMAAKMNYYYATVFLPVILTEKGVGGNESLKQSVCDDSIVAAYNLSYKIAEDMKLSPKVRKRKASIAAVAAEIGVRGYNNVDYSNVKASLGMNTIYNKKFIIELINLYSKISWGMLLFRGGVKSGRGYA